MSVAVRPASPGDLELIYALIRELAVYERLKHELVATGDDIGRLLFGGAPSAWCDIAEVNGEGAGFSLWFYSVSTFLGRRGLNLEDVFVREASRGQGAGLALLKALARRCVDEGLGRLEWAVLDWNAPSIAFYDALGAETMDGWTTRRLTGEALRELAG